MRKNLISFCFGILFGGLSTYLVNFGQIKFENFLTAQIAKPLEEINYLKVERRKKPPLTLDAKAVLSVRINPKKKIKERVLFAKNENEILPIASLTKLMSAVIVLEDENYDFDKKIKISYNSAKQGNSPNCGNLDFKIGKEMKIEELFELMLACSSNDAAYALSEVIGTENFIKKMNQKAKEIGLNYTNFFNPTGLDSEDGNLNYSTAEDLLKLIKYIFENHPIIFEFSLRERDYRVKNGFSVLKLKEGQVPLGGKTGYTKKAGGSLIFIFQNESGDVFMNVILGAENEEKRVGEMQKLIDWINS
jgi:D-alanyl-D-alanine carboxypeptidase